MTARPVASEGNREDSSDAWGFGSRDLGGSKVSRLSHTHVKCQVQPRPPPSRFSRDQSPVETRGNRVIFNVHFWMISRRRELSSSAVSGSNKQDGSINRLRCPPASLPPPPPPLPGSLMGRELLLRRGLRCKLICSNSAVISIKAA